MDHEVLLLAEKIELAKQIGETHFREFKSAYEGPPNEKKPRDPKSVAKDIAETLVAFANADGGELIVGMEDDGEMTGVGYCENTIQALLDLEAPKSHVHKDTPLPSSTGTSRTIRKSDSPLFLRPQRNHLHLSDRIRSLPAEKGSGISTDRERAHQVFARRNCFSRIRSSIR